MTRTDPIVEIHTILMTVDAEKDDRQELIDRLYAIREVAVESMEGALMQASRRRAQIDGRWQITYIRSVTNTVKAEHPELAKEMQEIEESVDVISGCLHTYQGDQS